jgi:hypothetical protein
MTPDQEFPPSLGELERRLMARTRPRVPPALRDRVLAGRAGNRASAERPFARRSASVFGGFAAVFLIAAVFWVSSSDETAVARANSDTIADNIELTAKQLERIGVSPVEARRSAVMFYASTKLPRLLVPQGPAMGELEMNRWQESNRSFRNRGG